MTDAAPGTAAVPAPALLQPAAIGVALAAAAAGCLLPWEQLTVSTLGQPSTSAALGSFHGTGIVAVSGVVFALITLADALRHGELDGRRRVALAIDGALLMIGSGFFTVTGGYRPGSGAGWSVATQPGLYLSGLAGVVLLAALAAPAVWRRAGSPRRGSAGAP